MENKQKYNEQSIKHLIDGTYTKQEARQALELLRDKKNDEVIDKHMSAVWKRILDSEDSSIFEYNRDLEQAEKLLRKVNKFAIYKRYFKYSIVAASIALLTSLGVIGFKYFNQMADSNLHWASISTDYGQTKEVKLPDGTVVVLNARTHLSYPEKFSAQERQIKLEGEAYFKVAKNDKQPFIINTQKFNVKVLGTVFNVKAYAGDKIHSVNVESGKVQVDMPESMSRLTQHEQIEINTTIDSYTKEKSQYKDIAVWRQGYFLFSRTPIEDVAKQLERIYNCRIVFNEGQAFDNIISGEHDNKNLREVLESIRITSGIKWKADVNMKNILLYK